MSLDNVPTDSEILAGLMGRIESIANSVRAIRALAVASGLRFQGVYADHEAYKDATLTVD